MNKFPKVIKWRVASVYNWVDGACILCNLMRPIILVLGDTGFKHLSFHFSSSGMITLLLTIPFNCLWNELVGSALSLEKWLSETKLLILSLNSLIHGFEFMRYSFQLFGYSVPQKTLIYGGQPMKLLYLLPGPTFWASFYSGDINYIVIPSSTTLLHPFKTQH